MIRTIIFDLGGVIITIDQPQAVRNFQEIGLKDAAMLLDPYTQQGVFGDLEEGLISDEDFRRELSRMVGRELTWEECQYGWLGYRKELPPRNLEALRRLREEGYRLVLLSNTNGYMQRWAETDFDGKGGSIADYFDALYRSYEVKLMKPDPKFFQLVLEREGLRPEEALFVDDGQRNVEVAESLGIKGYCPENGADWTQDIYKYLRS